MEAKVIHLKNERPAPKTEHPLVSNAKRNIAYYLKEIGAYQNLIKLGCDKEWGEKMIQICRGQVLYWQKHLDYYKKCPDGSSVFVSWKRKET